MNELAAIVKEARAAVAKGLPTLLATVVAVRGSSYRRPGARMLVTSEGWRAGSISGGCLEADITRKATYFASSDRPLLRTYDTSEDGDARLGCGGEVDVLLEPLTSLTLIDLLANVTESRHTLEMRTILENRIGEREVRMGGRVLYSTVSDASESLRCFKEELRPSPKLVIIGCGHDALPVARFADEMGWSIDVYDFRGALVMPERFPMARVSMASASALPHQLELEKNCLAVVMSHHLDYDAAALSILLRSDAPQFVGLLGPKRRANEVIDLVESQSRRLTVTERARLKTPVGLDLGAEGPAAVALSILAELQATLAGRSGCSLSLAPTSLLPRDEAARG